MMDQPIHKTEPQQWAKWQRKINYVELTAGGEKFIWSDCIVEVQQ